MLSDKEQRNAYDRGQSQATGEDAGEGNGRDDGRGGGRGGPGGGGRGGGRGGPNRAREHQAQPPIPPMPPVPSRFMSPDAIFDSIFNKSSFNDPLPSFGAEAAATLAREKAAQAAKVEMDALTKRCAAAGALLRQENAELQAKNEILHRECRELRDALAREKQAGLAAQGAADALRAELKGELRDALDRERQAQQLAETASAELAAATGSGAGGAAEGGRRRVLLPRPRPPQRR